MRILNVFVILRFFKSIHYKSQLYKGRILNPLQGHQGHLLRKQGVQGFFRLINRHIKVNSLQEYFPGVWKDKILNKTLILLD